MLKARTTVTKANCGISCSATQPVSRWKFGLGNRDQRAISGHTLAGGQGSSTKRGCSPIASAGGSCPLSSRPASRPR
jgi:hypothetical protein